MISSLNGWLIINKPQGITSAHVVGKVKRLTGAKKVGHAGTLDPMATGVLPIALGEATKTTGYMLGRDKTYNFTITFGASTDTDDAEGQVVEQSKKLPTLAEIEEAIPYFTGEIEQTPPAYSAIKVDGKRAYKMAREGEDFKLKSRKITIYELAVGSWQLAEQTYNSPLAGESKSQSDFGGGYNKSLEFRVQSLEENISSLRTQRPNKDLKLDVPPPESKIPTPPQGGNYLKPLTTHHSPLTQITLTCKCSKGTYIRSLARDLAHKIGSLGHISMLHRVESGQFTEKDAISLDYLEKIVHKADPSKENEALLEVMLPVEAGLDDIPVLLLTPEDAENVAHGRKFSASTYNGKTHPLMQLYFDGKLLAIGELQGELIKSVRGFNL